jgi:hypothetical protein
VVRRSVASPTSISLLRLSGDVYWAHSNGGLEHLNEKDIAMCIKVIIWLHFYRTSPTKLFDEDMRDAYHVAKSLNGQVWSAFLKGLQNSSTPSD